MRTTFVLNDQLVREALALSGVRTNRALIDLAHEKNWLCQASHVPRGGRAGRSPALGAALRQMVARHRQRSLKSLIGRDLIAPDYDVRAVRRAMARGAG